MMLGAVLPRADATESVCLIDAQPAGFLTPAIIGLVSESGRHANFAQAASLTRQQFLVGQFADDLHCTKAFPCSALLPIRGTCPIFHLGTILGVVPVSESGSTALKAQRLVPVLR
jgi:hypothetical protein